LSPIQEQQAQRQVNLWLQHGVVEPIATPPLLNNIVMASKKDGGIRVCIDCTPANKVTQEFNWPLPRLQDIRFRIKGATWFFRLDLKDAFFRIRIPVAFRYLTAFMVGGVAYQFRRMPFGLKTAPATFQRFMDWGLSEFTGRAVWYIDDVMGVANSLPELMVRERQIRARLHDMGCEINETKCVGGRTSLLFAGLWIMGAGIGPNLQQVEKIFTLPPPRTKAEAQSALGLVSYLRDFIPLISHFTAMLYPDKQGLRLGLREYEEAWRRLLRHLASALTINHHWRESIPADLYTDASLVGLGVIVIQERRIVALASRKLSAAETRYDATDREHLGLVFAAQKLRTILHAHEQVNIWTDHSALLTRKSDRLLPRQARWQEIVHAWIPNLAHVKGKSNPADFISRWKLGVMGAVCRA
jgi:hypothetical protein